ncbi:hypothetical protein [Metallosphaera hakonensis]|uniref:hypothetical protein n=1 Tax=Metallosphaera hakonensis TaxID=79601 RepID=UPI0020937F51|nr:hypothetical protein [Metallosphaera hakonensis]
MQPQPGGETALYMIQIAGLDPEMKPGSVLLTDRRILYSHTVYLKNESTGSTAGMKVPMIATDIATAVIRLRNIMKIRDIASSIPSNEIIKELRIPMTSAPQLINPRELLYGEIREVQIESAPFMNGTRVEFRSHSFLRVRLEIEVPNVNPQNMVYIFHDTPLRNNIRTKF